MNQARYKEFDDVSFSAFQKSLLREKGSERQRELLEAARSDQAFTELIRREIKVVGYLEPPLYAQTLCEGEFKQTPKKTEREMYKTWRELPRRYACRAAFWGHLTMRHIENGYLKAHYLAAKANQNGLAAIDEALTAKGDASAKALDSCVRSVLRRLSGLPQARGNRSVYTDCPFARAWWREKLVSDIAEEGERADSIRRVLRVNQTYWETLIVMVVSRNSALGSENVLHALIKSLADLMDLDPQTPLRTASRLKLLCRSVGVIQASRELSILDEKELQRIMDELVLTAHDVVQSFPDRKGR